MPSSLSHCLDRKSSRDKNDKKRKKIGEKRNVWVVLLASSLTGSSGFTSVPLRFDVDSSIVASLTELFLGRLTMSSLTAIFLSNRNGNRDMHYLKERAHANTFLRCLNWTCAIAALLNWSFSTWMFSIFKFFDWWSEKGWLAGCVSDFINMMFICGFYVACLLSAIDQCWNRQWFKIWIITASRHLKCMENPTIVAAKNYE